MASLDHISGARAGWNMVTSWSADEARNYNLDAPLSSAVRHARAAEFVDVVKGLWDSWDDNAFNRDKASGIYFERDRFHFQEHKGDFFQVRGPLDTARPPQGCLPIITAGSSTESQRRRQSLHHMRRLLSRTRPNRDLIKKTHYFRYVADCASRHPRCATAKLAGGVAGQLPDLWNSACSLQIMHAALPSGPD
jgi:hypothetical protein